MTLFVALTAIAIITQAGVLIAIYLMSKRLSEQVERFMRDTREMMMPVRSIAENLRVWQKGSAVVSVPSCFEEAAAPSIRHARTKNFSYDLMDIPLFPLPNLV